MVHNQKLVAAIKCKGKTLRENGEEVYLPFGSEYSILLKNLNTTKALVDVHVDGQKVITGLIIHPEQETELERFFEGSMDSGHRLKFIEKTKDISQFRGDFIEDGLVRIEYRFEKNAPGPFIEEPGIHYRWPWEDTWSRRTKIGSGEPWWMNSDENTSGNVRGFLGSTTKGPFFGSSDGPAFQSSEMNMSFNSQQASYSENEQGITTQGDYSNQSFKYGSIGTLESNSYSIVIQLKGETPSQKEVEKPLTTREKIQCSVCGKKWRSNHKFCGNCGTCLV